MGQSGDEPTTIFLDDIPLEGVTGVTDAGEMKIPEGARVIDASGKLLLPALFDLHAKIEIPGCSKRESIYRTGQAAIQGGVWGMLVMPTRGFCFDNASTLDSFDDAATQRSAAAMIPAGPPPTTNTSTSSLTGICLDGSVIVFIYLFNSRFNI